MKIILASASPARKKLLREIVPNFECHISGYEEDMFAYKQPARLAKFLALQKALFIADKYPSSIIIGADTFGSIGKRIIGKPESHKEAKEIFRMKSGKEVKIHTGVAVIKTDKNGEVIQKLIEHVVTYLTFGKITDKDINHILKNDNVLEVAAGLTIEGESGKFIKTIYGDYNNVIGLPIFQLKKMLEKVS